MNDILNILKSFNRKERYFLVRQALGNRDFRICNDFRQTLISKFSLNIPENAYTAMDYHLDWIHASLELAHNNEIIIRSNENKFIHASAEDIDFLVAFEDHGICHLIFLEAKGVKLFDNDQLKSKAKRLGEFFGNTGDKYTGVVPHFAIISPKEPQKLKYAEWPDWAHYNGSVKWIPLVPEYNLLKVVRCDVNGKHDKGGSFWKIEPAEF